jgi:transcriptional regulator with XRE-family HTH domain
MESDIHFCENLRFLRGRDKKSQSDLAQNLDITRAKLNSYENGVAQNPPMDLLVKLTDYFKVSIDNMIRMDLSKVSDLKIRQLNDEYLSGNSLRILATTVSPDNRDNIELVPLRVMAGYTAGYSDPDFIASLPTFQLPFLAHERKYRAFQIEGDSMLPIPSGSFVIGEYVLNWEDIKSGHGYIVVTNEDGAVFKIVQNQIRQKRNLQLASLNSLYPPYEVAISEVKEVWKFINYFSDEMPEALSSQEQILQRLVKVESKLQGFSNREEGIA